MATFTACRSEARVAHELTHGLAMNALTCREERVGDFELAAAGCIRYR